MAQQFWSDKELTLAAGNLTPIGQTHAKSIGATPTGLKIKDSIITTGAQGQSTEFTENVVAVGDDRVITFFLGVNADNTGSSTGSLSNIVNWTANGDKHSDPHVLSDITILNAIKAVTASTAATSIWDSETADMQFAYELYYGTVPGVNPWTATNTVSKTNADATAIANCDKITVGWNNTKAINGSATTTVKFYWGAGVIANAAIESSQSDTVTIKASLASHTTSASKTTIWDTDSSIISIASATPTSTGSTLFGTVAGKTNVDTVGVNNAWSTSAGSLSSTTSGGTTLSWKASDAINKSIDVTVTSTVSNLNTDTKTATSTVKVKSSLAEFTIAPTNSWIWNDSKSTALTVNSATPYTTGGTIYTTAATTDNKVITAAATTITSNKTGVATVSKGTGNSWTVSSANTATINGSDTVTLSAVATGIAAEDKNASTTVEVRNAVNTITFNGSTADTIDVLFVGGTKDYSYTLAGYSPGTVYNNGVTVSNDNTSLGTATVGAGKVTFAAGSTPGTAKLQLTSAAGVGGSTTKTSGILTLSVIAALESEFALNCGDTHSINIGKGSTVEVIKVNNTSATTTDKIAISGLTGGVATDGTITIEAIGSKVSTSNAETVTIKVTTTGGSAQDVVITLQHVTFTLS